MYRGLQVGIIFSLPQFIKRPAQIEQWPVLPVSIIRCLQFNVQALIVVQQNFHIQDTGLVVNVLSQYDRIFDYALSYLIHVQI